ncbi:MAG: hypothetical protein MJZ87_02470 [Bacteroidales bacterium]|nr:hypothetical protein [Bacteroidales bacterium]
MSVAFFVCTILVRTDDHAVLLVHELVHLRPYLFDGGLHLLAVDVDGNPAGAAFCHNLIFWQRWFKHPSRIGTATGKRCRALWLRFCLP